MGVLTMVCTSCWADYPSVALSRRVTRTRVELLCKKCQFTPAAGRSAIAKEKAVALKGGKCQDCGLVFPACVFDFHHVDPAVKEENISQLLRGPFDLVVEELEKCIMLCANCHRIVHYGE